SGRKCVWLSMTSSRPRRSKATPTGWTMSGEAAKRVTSSRGSWARGTSAVSGSAAREATVGQPRARSSNAVKHQEPGLIVFILPSNSKHSDDITAERPASDCNAMAGDSKRRDGGKGRVFFSVVCRFAPTRGKRETQTWDSRNMKVSPGEQEPSAKSVKSF